MSRGNIDEIGEPDWRTLVAYLNRDSLADENAEKYLTGLRRVLLQQASEGAPESPRLLPLLSGLAKFCADNEFVFAETREELDRLAHLEPERSPSHAALMRCYRAAPFAALPISEIRQLRAPSDAISRAVQSQYEENPYPRWTKLPIGPINDDAQRILIAGCGTGRHALLNAQPSPRSQVVAIDLSRASLAYGLMKAREYGIRNVEFLQADILDVGLLGRKFDIVSSVGVLHHMDDPLAGLVALKSVMAPGATLKFAVYAAPGRASILAAIALRQRLGLPSTPQGIRQLRQAILDLPADDAARGVSAEKDFYSLSGCRDLVFHVKEHNYTVPKLAELIGQSQMKLVRFQVPAKVLSQFEQAGYRDPLDLRDWAAFEKRFPITSETMYRASLAR